MNMTDSKKYLENNDQLFDKTEYIKSRDKKRDMMLYLEEKGSLEPVLLLNIKNMLSELDKTISQNECQKIVIYHFLHGPIKTLTVENIKHELNILAKLGFKYQLK